MSQPTDDGSTPGPFPARVGIWTGTLDGLPAAQAAEAAAELDELGYGSLWFGEAYGREAFTNASMLLAATTRLTVATGIASIYARDAMTMNAAAQTVAAAFPGRFVLGMGVSHVPLVERVRGHAYLPPVTAMRDYLDRMEGAPFWAVAPERPAPWVLAALGPKMLELARDRTDGAHPYLVTPEHTAQARAALGDGPVLAVEQAAVLTSDPEVARERAHTHLEFYTGLPNYRNSWLRQGYDESDFVRGGSQRLKDALVVWGDEAAVRRRVDDHLAAGASHVCVQVLGAAPGEAPRADWRALAPALTM